jgi:hypothetical protein
LVQFSVKSHPQGTSGVLLVSRHRDMMAVSLPFPFPPFWAMLALFTFIIYADSFTINVTVRILILERLLILFRSRILCKHFYFMKQLAIKILIVTELEAVVSRMMAL